MRFLFLGFFMLGLFGMGQAQDRIVIRGGDTLSVYITDLTEETVTFRFEDRGDAPLLHMPASRVVRILSRNIGNHDFTYGNVRLKRPYGLGVGGTGLQAQGLVYPSLSADYFPIGSLQLWLSLSLLEGTDFQMLVAGHYHFLGRYNSSAWSPFVGLQAGVQPMEDFLQLPVGISWIGDRGLGADAFLGQRITLAERGLTRTWELDSPSLWRSFFLGLRFSYRF